MGADVELFLISNPHFSTNRWANTEPFCDAVTLEHFVDGFGKAGVTGRRNFLNGHYRR
jgi:hypothetical protein